MDKAIKSKIILFFVGLLTVSSAHASSEMAVYGESARVLAQALMNSGLKAEVKGESRTIQVANLVIAHDDPKTLCENIESVNCGFKPAPVIYFAQQKESRLKVREAIQLADALVAVMDPILNSRHINIDSTQEGRVYREYGNLRCSWELRKLQVDKAECLLIRESNESKKD